MAQYELLLPKMGESVAEATIIKWVKQPGDFIQLDDTLLEIATDKVDSEVPSPVEGKLVKLLYKEDDVVQVGAVIAIIDTHAAVDAPEVQAIVAEEAPQEEITAVPFTEQFTADPIIAAAPLAETAAPATADRFYSPLVKNIAAQENISIQELNTIKGSGAEGRLTKDDLLQYIQESRGQAPNAKAQSQPEQAAQSAPAPAKTAPAPVVSMSGGDEIFEMDRMRKLIAEHMVMSKQKAPHVTSFVEADVTNMVKWRDRVKKNFEKRENEKITFTP
ncbi:biotin/lipoyl-containing protein, partial [Pedobacter sp.]|uniref:biotin/lipoyl-containing protein n=1 Tax=Pedobacter sp. TaxID=1411316 RepID=UPI003D7F27A7